MKYVKIAGAAALAVSIMAMAESAQADVYNWTSDIPAVSGPDIVGSGTITVTGGFATAITGTYGAANIVGLDTNSADLYSYSADNKVYVSSSPLLDEEGLLFFVDKDPGADEGETVNFYHYTPLGYSDQGHTKYGTFTLTPASSAPEPGVWAELLLGFSALGGVTRLRRRAFAA
jgi:hypothetical protein